MLYLSPIPDNEMIQIYKLCDSKFHKVIVYKVIDLANWFRNSNSNSDCGGT